MCGISGIISKKNERIIEKEIKNINDLISHRGPDSEGFYYSDHFAFGHRRLSILDLSNDGHQPMQYLEKYVITYNGEIYNYLEIKEELISYGYIFNSKTDTEVILASYDKWGSECVKKFNGMWAFSIFDKIKNILFCSRDRFGIKPFYFTDIDDKFIFGSEIKQLLEFHPTNYVNKKILMDYLVLGLEEHTNQTFFQNISKLEQSHNLTYDLKLNTYKIEKYYDIILDENISNMTEDESIIEYNDKLKESIKIRLRSDVKVGTCLSGGLDSSAIASMAADSYNMVSTNRFLAIHAKSSQSNNDESEFAQIVADYCNLDLKIIEPKKEDFINYINEVVYTQEEPFGGPSIFMQYFVMKKAKEENCKVLLDGQGGDETLLGYERYYPAYLKSLTFTKMFKEFFAITRNSKLTLKQLFSYIIYFTNSKIRIQRLKARNKFIKEEYLNLIDIDLIKESSKSYLNIFELQYNEIYKTQMPHLLKYEDKNSMRNSIETRLPFIDYQVLESAISINNSFKVSSGWTKYILRNVVNPILPKSIVWRKIKFGFEAPTKTWLDSIKNDMDCSIRNSSIITSIIGKEIEFDKITNNQKWKLYNVSKWEEIYNVKIK